MTPEDLNLIEKWANDPDADCVEIVDHAVPDLIAEVRRLQAIEAAAGYVVDSADAGYYGFNPTTRLREALGRKGSNADLGRSSQSGRSSMDDRERNVQQRLYATTDAAVWAREWCQIARKIQTEGGELVDEGWMIGWFANAIENAKVHVRRDLGLDEPDAMRWIGEVSHSPEAAIDRIHALIDGHDALGFTGSQIREAMSGEDFSGERPTNQRRADVMNDLKSKEAARGR